MHRQNSRVTYKATTAPLLSPALHNISLIADVRALVLSREEGPFGQEQQKKKKKDMAELFSEVVSRNGNDKGNGKKNIIAIQFLRF